MNTPMMMPVPISSTPAPKCPNCDKTKSTKVVCKHCDYEYKSKPDPWWLVPAWIGGILFVVYLFIVILNWVVAADICPPGEDPPTLLSIFTAQWEFIRNLKLW